MGRIHPVLAAFLILLLSGASSFIAAQSSAAELEASMPQADPRGAGGTDANATTWTIALYMSADNNLGTYAYLDKKEILDAGVPPWVNVAVLMDGPASDDTRLSVIVGNEEISVPSFGPSEMDLSKPETLAAYINWTRENLPSERFCLCLWGHGAGWRGLLVDKGEQMPLPDLGLALEWATDPLFVIDLLVVDACSMATFELAVEVAPYTMFLLASEMEIPDYGMPYDLMVETLTDDPDIPRRDLGESICKGYMAVSRQRSQYSVSISLVDLTYYREEAIPVNAARRFADDVLLWTPGASVQLKDARDSAEEYQKGDAYDLGDLLDNVISDDSLIFMRKDAEWFRENYASTILYHERLDHANPLDGVHVRRSTGLVLQFYWGNAPADYNELLSSRLSGWGNATDALTAVTETRTLAITEASFSGEVDVSFTTSGAALDVEVALYLTDGTLIASAVNAYPEGDHLASLASSTPEWVIPVAAVFEGGRAPLVSTVLPLWTCEEYDDLEITDVSIFRADGARIPTLISGGGITAIAGQPTTFRVTVDTWWIETPVTIRVTHGVNTLASRIVLATPEGTVTEIELELPEGILSPLFVEAIVPESFPDAAEPNVYPLGIIVASATPSQLLTVRVNAARTLSGETQFVVVTNERTGEKLAEGYAVDGEMAFTLYPGDFIEGDTIVATSSQASASAMAYSADGILVMELQGGGGGREATLLVVLFITMSISALFMAAIARSMHARHNH